MIRRWTRQISMATMRVERWFRFVHYWEVEYWLPGVAKSTKVCGVTYTFGGARRSALAALGGLFLRNSTLMPHQKGPPLRGADGVLLSNAGVPIVDTSTAKEVPDVAPTAPETARVAPQPR